MTGRRTAVAAAAVAAAVAVTVTAVASARHPGGGDGPTVGAAAGGQAATAAEQQPGDGLSRTIAKQQAQLRAEPANAQGWASLGLEYVQQAKNTVDPAYYPKARGALARSLSLQPKHNYVAMAGEASLQAALHRFRAARHWAVRGLRIDPQSAALWGALDDADTQLGRYAQAFHAVRRMNALRPGVPASTRAEYVYELRGDLGSARIALRTARGQATQPADQAFIRYYLAELALGSGHPARALRQDVLGLQADPTYSALLEGKAKAEAALGRTTAAVHDFLTVVSEVPQPQYVVEAGELLQSLGRNAEAKREYRLFGTENRLFEANGVRLDTDPTLFYADHGQPKKALSYGRAGIRVRPFVEMDDAYAWALHANGRDAAALRWEARARALGTRNALFDAHAGMIEASLGDRGAAVRDLHLALRTNPHFNPLLAPLARRTLHRLVSR